MTKCIIENCDEQISKRSELEVCAVCRQSFSYWRKKTPAHRMERVRKLAKYQDRLTNLKSR